MTSLRPLSALLGGFALFLAACTASDAPSTEQQAGGSPPGTLSTTAGPAPAGSLDIAPDVVLPTLAGDSLRLSDLRGQIVLVNFWATWCAPCIQEIPELIALHNELNPHGLTVVGITIDDEGPELVAPFVKHFGITYPIPLDADGAVAETFGGTWALPTTYVIDPEGRITQRVIGIFPVEEMRPRFRKQLGLPPAKKAAE